MNVRERGPLRDAARFAALPENAQHLFNRVPFGYTHTLAELDLFAFDTLCGLARRYDRDYFVAASAPTAGTPFYATAPCAQHPGDAMEQLDRLSYRVLLKRPEQYDERYRELMQALFDQVLSMRGGLAPGEQVIRLDSSILISSSATITPFHFDPEVSHFFQIEGDKTYHLYPPRVLSEVELERFYQMGIVNIGQIELDGLDPSDECVFQLRAGFGMHQPQNSPHWVETHSSRSISFVIAFETNRSRALGRTRAYNYYLRKLGLTPTPPGTRPGSDAAKASIMRAAIPARKKLRAVLRPVVAPG